MQSVGEYIVKKILLLILCAVCFYSLTACSEYKEPTIADSEVHVEETFEPVPVATEHQPEVPVKTVEINSAAEWNEFAEDYNVEREKYAEYLCIEITGILDFSNIDFVPLADGFSGKIIGKQILSEKEREEWIQTRKKWPQDYSGTFINISGFNKSTNPISKSLFGNAKVLELENIGFANIYLDGAECIVAESADVIDVKGVSIVDCMLPDGKAIIAIDAGDVSVEKFVAESCFLTGYEYMAGLVVFVEDNAKFEDIFICRCSFILSPDNGGSGLWGAGIGLLAKSVIGDAHFENIDIYACTTTGLQTDALAGSVGNLIECRNISLERCNFINYGSLEASVNTGLITNVGETRFIETPVIEVNVSMKECVIGGEYKEEDFLARGYHVNKCIFVPFK